MTTDHEDIPVPELPVVCPAPRLRRELPRCRRINLGDWMIVTGALGCWMAHLAQLIVPGGTGAGLALAVIGSFPGLLVVLTCAYCVMRLRRPRPPWGQVLRQPGMMGSLAMAATIPAGIVLPMLLDGSGSWWWPLILPATIMGTWIVAASRGALRPEHGWIDSMGRTIAAGWCLLGLFLCFLDLFGVT